VCGVEHDGQVWLAGDSAVSGGGFVRAAREPKVRAVSGLVIGGGGGSRELDIVLTWTPPRYTSGDPWRWAVLDLVPSLRQALTQAGIGEPELEILVGIGGRLFEMDGTLSPVSYPEGYAAVGTKVGAAAALGVLHKGGWRTPNRRLTAALEAAASLCP
jgi:hypothetical protein